MAVPKNHGCRRVSSHASIIAKCSPIVKMMVLSQRLALLLSLILSVTVAQAQNASDAPSDVPSMVPAASLPSQLPTIIPSNDNGGGSNVTVPNGACTDVSGCTSFSTLPDLADYLSSVRGPSTLCLCPVVYTNEYGACGTTPTEPSISVLSGQDLTIECDSKLGAKCVFACEPVAFAVETGGKLTLHGNAVMEFTRGRIYTRLFVYSGGAATVMNAVFREYVSSRPSPPEHCYCSST